MPEAQAEVLADEQVRLIDDRLATKEDIAKPQAAIKTDIREMQLKIEDKLESAKSEIIRWMFGTMGFQTIVVVGAVALARLAH